MADRYLPLSLNVFTLGQPVPVDVWNERGVLLLSRGQVIQSGDVLRSLAAQRPMVREEDYQGWADSVADGVALLRAGVAVVAPAAAHRPTASAVPTDQLDLLTLTALRSGAHVDPVDVTLRLSKTLSALLRDGAQRSDFLERFEAVHSVLKWLAQTHADDTLFMLLQLLQEPTLAHSYSGNHALAAAALLRLMVVHWSEELEQPVETLARAALSMNIGMYALHNQLRAQRTPPDPQQRRQIHEHPNVSATLLRELGVDDEGWLWLVEHHHEASDGTGYPAGRRVQASGLMLLQLADRFTAGLAPRSYRQALAPLNAIRNVYNAGSAQHKVLGEALVKALGFYPPGSYVRLANQETAVVVRRGPSARQPLVVSITSSQNIALAIPVLRDTRLSEFAVVAPVSPEVVRVRLDPARILKRV